MGVFIVCIFFFDDSKGRSVYLWFLIVKENEYQFRLRKDSFFLEFMWFEKFKIVFWI